MCLLGKPYQPLISFYLLDITNVLCGPQVVTSLIAPMINIVWVDLGILMQIIVPTSSIAFCFITSRVSTLMDLKCLTLKSLR